MTIRLVVLCALVACESAAPPGPPAPATATPGPILGIAGPAETDGPHATIRRGVVVIDGQPRVFSLRGPAELDSPYTTLAIDHQGAPQTIQLFEQTINLGAHTYDVAVDPRGDRLTLTARATRLADRPALDAGSPAPDFAIEDFDGHRLQLAALRGHPVLLDFWSTTCAPCVKALPQLAALYQRHHPRGFELIGIAGDTADDLRSFFASTPHVGRVALDDDQVSAQYRVGWWPAYFLVDATGRIAVSRGSLDDVAAYLDSH